MDDKERTITIMSRREKVKIECRTVLYASTEKNNAYIHISDGQVYESRITLEKLKRLLGEDFIMIHRSYLVSALAIHDITNKVHLIKGDSLNYAVHRKKEIIAQYVEVKKRIISCCHEAEMPTTNEEYHEHYKSFDKVPFAYADIEMVFDDEQRVIDWIFRYGNEKLAEIEKVPLERMIGNTFGNVFENMDPKWLSSYERSAFLGETLQVVDYSPEIDTVLSITCFPTFPGHCGCILFDVEKIKTVAEISESANAMMLYVSHLFAARVR